MNASLACWAVVPAAGIGRRMGTDIPKQYLELGGKTIIEHAIQSLFANPAIQGIVVALSEDDIWWDQLAVAFERPLVRVPGGAERSDSVLNALRGIEAQVSSSDWVLVHDAVRPCLRLQDLDRLLHELEDDAMGGLLAVPVRDTMKRSNSDRRVSRTIDRDALWHALTPQMFRFGPLVEALETVSKSGATVTDEASAMEYMGYSPKLVEGHADNIKITRSEDLALAEFYLRQQGRL